MERPARMTLERRWTGAVAALGLGYAVLASFTRPFTWDADVVTAVPLLFAVLLVARSVRGERGQSGGGPGGGEIDVASGQRRWEILWVVPTLAVVGWELYCFTNMPRDAHPTLSSLLDMLDGTHGGKAVAFALWLVAGWALVKT